MFQRSLVQGGEPPLRSLLSDERIADLFAEEGISFSEDEDAVSTPTVALWRLLSQAFFKGELGLRAIKVTLGMDVLRARTPEMFRTELCSKRQCHSFPTFLTPF